MSGTTVGAGLQERPLTDAEVRGVCAAVLEPLPLDGKRVLVLIPDHTRHAPIALFFRVLYDLLGARVAVLDYLIATGTHAPMEPDRINRHLGVAPEEYRTRFPKVRVFNHEHAAPDALAELGEIPGAELRELTGGVFDSPIRVTVNRRIPEADHVLIVSPVVPHETMGFAGGNKYFFPGAAGLEVVETFHWLGALLTNPVVNGVKQTATRAVIDRAAELLSVPRTCFAFAVDAADRLRCLFGGDVREAWSRAADVSALLHIRRRARPVARVLAVTPPIYEELWVGGKAMYKLEPVVAEGGELVIYGPAIRTLSFMHDAAIRRLGYHVIGWFTGQWERFAGEPKLIMAHSSNVRGTGTYAGGVERPRIRVTLATGIPAEVCAAVNLGYRDWRTIDPAAWTRQQNDDLLVVENAGQDLYRLEDVPSSPRNS